MARSQLALLLLALCLLRLLVPLDLRGGLVLLGLAALPCSALGRARLARVPVELLGASASGLALCGLALQSPEIWLQAGLASALVSGGALALGALPRRAVALSWGLGLLAPLALGALIALVSPGGRLLLLGSLGDWGFGIDALPRLAQWLALSLALLAGVTAAGPSPQRPGWLAALALGTLGAVLLPRVVWLASTLGLPTDLLIWSEPPLLLNLWKLRAGEAFYGPFSRLNSYSYSPTLEHVQYALLRPLGLELSLVAHRGLGVMWQLLAALCVAAGLARHLGQAGSLRALLLLSCLGVLFSSLLAPHLHPDHLLMLCLGGALWLVMRDERAEPPSRLRLALLVAVPVVATMVKLTGAGIGLGLGLSYLGERDRRRVAWLLLSGLLAVSTIWLFDAIFGHFSDYALRLQASHPLDVERTLSVWATPPVLLWLVALVVTGFRYRVVSDAPALRAAVRVHWVTAGIGLTSLLAYAKHGGRDNSLLPFALGGVVALVLALAATPEAATRRRSPAWLYPLLAASVALVTPIARPVLGEARAEVVQMHQSLVGWLSDSARQNRRVFATSTAAYLAAGWPQVPDTSLATLAELELAKRREVAPFAERIHSGYYDGLVLPASTLRLSPLFQRLLPSLQQGYRVTGPPALAGAWPTGLAGYVIVERRVARDIR